MLHTMWWWDGYWLLLQADRVSKLYAAYCKYLLPYETLSDEETKKLIETVETDRLRDEKEMDKAKTMPAYYKSVYKVCSWIWEVWQFVLLSNH